MEAGGKSGMTVDRAMLTAGRAMVDGLRPLVNNDGPRLMEGCFLATCDGP